jgi:two-component system OmpR family response regulator
MATYPSILAMHSDASLRENLAFFLRQAGAGEITLCASPEQAKGHLEQQSFGLLLIQYRLEDENGVAFTRKLREEGKNMPVVILSRNPDSRAILETLSLPNAEFLKVPFSLEQWEDTIDALLTGAKEKE